MIGGLTNQAIEVNGDGTIDALDGRRAHVVVGLGAATADGVVTGHIAMINGSALITVGAQQAGTAWPTRPRARPPCGPGHRRPESGGTSTT